MLRVQQAPLRNTQHHKAISGRVARKHDRIFSPYSRDIDRNNLEQRKHKENRDNATLRRLGPRSSITGVADMPWYTSELQQRLHPDVQYEAADTLRQMPLDVRLQRPTYKRARPVNTQQLAVKEGKWLFKDLLGRETVAAEKQLERGTWIEYIASERVASTARVAARERARLREEQEARAAAAAAEPVAVVPIAPVAEDIRLLEQVEMEAEPGPALMAASTSRPQTTPLPVRRLRPYLQSPVSPATRKQIPITRDLTPEKVRMRRSLRRQIDEKRDQLELRQAANKALRQRVRQQSSSS